MKKEQIILKDVEKYFNFLHEKGFTISLVDYAPFLNGNWMVEYKSHVFTVNIISDRDEISIEFSDIHKRTNLNIGQIVYVLSNQREILSSYTGNFAWGKNKQLLRLSTMLERYIDQIIDYFNLEQNQQNEQ